LWELWLLNGLADGRVALLLRLHHVVADGAAALEMFSSMHDRSPGTPVPAPVSENIARRPPTIPSPAASYQAQHAHSPAARLKSIAAGGAMRDRRGWAVARLGMAPALSWNQPVGSRRVHRFVRGDLARSRHALQPNGRFQQRWVVHVMAHQRLINMVLSNMPGPPVPLSFTGASVQEMFQIGLLQGNCAVGVGVLSYAGQLNVDIVADPDVVPDPEVFTKGVAEAFDQLGVARTTITPRVADGTSDAS
jgi:hypothetical protein